MVKGHFRPTEDEHAAYLEEMRGWLSDGDPIPDIDEQESCRILSAIDDGVIAPEDVRGIASNEAVITHVGEVARNQMLIRELIAASRGRR